MGGFPAPSIGPAGGTAGGVPQWFSSRDPHTFFPGVPQGNFAMSHMLGDFGANDADLASLMSGYDKYGSALESLALNKGVAGTTTSQDMLAKAFATQRGAGTEGEGLEQGSELGAQADYGAKLMGTTNIGAEAQRAARDVPGQIALQKQAVQNAYRQNQMKGLAQMISLASQMAGSNYGYQAAQLGADRGQIALSNAQNQEAQSNLSGMMSMLFGNQMPSLFGGGNMSAFGPMGQGGGFANSFLNNWLSGPTAGAGSMLGTEGLSAGAQSGMGALTQLGAA